MSIFIPTDSLDALARKLCIGPYATVQEQKLTPAENTEFNITENDYHFVMKGIHYQGGYQDIEWRKDLLKKVRTQDEWFEFFHGSEYKLPDAPLYHATLAHLYRCKDGPKSNLVKRIRAMFAKKFRNNYLMTGTRVVYDPLGKDIVKHNLSGVTKQATIVGANDTIHSQSGFDDSIEALLGTRDLTEVEQVYKWISGNKPYLYRQNTQPQKITEKAVVLGVDNYGRFSIIASSNINNRWPALMVVCTGAKNSR